MPSEELPKVSISGNRYEISGFLEEGIPSLLYVINGLGGNNASIAAYTKPLEFNFTGFLLDEQKKDALGLLLATVASKSNDLYQLSVLHTNTATNESNKLSNRLYRAWKGTDKSEYVKSEAAERMAKDTNYHGLIESINADLESFRNGLSDAFPEKVSVDGIEIDRDVFPNIDFDQLVSTKGNVFHLLKTSLRTEIPESYLRVKTSIEPWDYEPLIREGFTSCHIDMLVIGLADSGIKLSMTKDEDLRAQRGSLIARYKITVNDPGKFNGKMVDLLADLMYRKDSNEQIMFRCYVKNKLKGHDSNVKSLS